MRAYERFLHYVSYDTQSDSASQSVPSTSKQKILGAELVQELQTLGLSDARMDDSGYVYATLPASAGYEQVDPVALIAHMDTAMDMSGADIKPRIVKNYDGGDILLNQKLGITTRVSDFPELKRYVGEDLIVTDGTTLLGADDKAGIAEIITMAEELLAHPEKPHPPVKLVFTTDEEIGRGVDHLDLEQVGARRGYTVDGGAVGDLKYENFNAASAQVTIHGITAHTGYAKGILRNATLLAMEFHAMLPIFENPACTENREGFYHLDRLEGRTELAELHYIIRDHDMGIFQRRKQLMEQAAAYLNEKYGNGTVELKIEDSYYNMYEQIRPHYNLVEYAAQAMRICGVEPVSEPPIRGGTDGSRLSYMGLPSPNLCTGGHNGHGRHEFVSIQSMDKVVEILVALMGIYANEGSN